MLFLKSTFQYAYHIDSKTLGTNIYIIELIDIHYTYPVWAASENEQHEAQGISHNSSQ